MEQECKKRILFLFPGAVYRPGMANFADKFKKMSACSEGVILTKTYADRYSNCILGEFKFFALPVKSSIFLAKIIFPIFLVKKALHEYKKKPFDLIVCYDPMFTGVIGSFLKVIFKCKLIVEINSENYFGAVQDHYGKGLIQSLKSFLFKVLSNIALSSADAIKILSETTRRKLPKRLQKKKIFCFHGYIPTHYFSIPEKTDEKYILCVGHPFYLKGVDILIKAFLKKSELFKESKLVLIGHKLEEEAKKEFPELPSNIEFCKGLFYDHLKKYFEGCYCLVLPSRTEGMGRVLIEAMACGKPVVGSNVGGIPSVIEDGRNGFLFEAENVNDLADKLVNLLSDQELAKRMGEEGLKIVAEKFSSEKYVENFKKMLDDILITKINK